MNGNVKQKLDSVSEIARRLRVSRQAINAYFQGHLTPGPRMAKKLEAVTGIPRLSWMYPDEYHNPLIKKAPDGNGTPTPA
jgi:transcriptional regulator with XRE-family HTH domain